MSAGCLSANISYAQAQGSPVCDDDDEMEFDVAVNGLFLYSVGAPVVSEDITMLGVTERELARLEVRSPAPGHDTVSSVRDRLVVFDLPERLSLVMIPIFLGL